MPSRATLPPAASCAAPRKRSADRPWRSVFMTARRRFGSFRWPPPFGSVGALAVLVLALVLVPALACSASAELKDIAPGLKGELSSETPPQGGILVLTLESSEPLKAEEITGSFQGKEFPFYATGERTYGA